MNESLYHISREYEDIFLALSESDFDAETIDNTLAGIESKFEDKAINVARFIANLEAQEEAIKQAAARMATRKKAVTNKIENLREYLLQGMQRTGINDVFTPELSIKIKKNPKSVIIENEDAIPARYKTIVETVKIDKAKIKANQGCPGAPLEQKLRVEIK